MDELRKNIIACHKMLDMIRIRKNIDASVEALKNDLEISRSTADGMYKRLLGGETAAPLIVRELRTSKIIGERGYFLGVSIGSKHIRVAVLNLNFDPLSHEQMSHFPVLKDILHINTALKDKPDLFDGGTTWFCEEEDGFSYVFRSPEDSAKKLEAIRFFIPRLVRLFLEQAEQGPEVFPLMGIGFALSGPVDYEAKVWRSAPHITNVRDINLSDLLGHELLQRIDALELFLSLDNNSKASAVSEYQYLLEKNNGQYREDIAVIYIGSGVGSAAVLDQKLLRGSHNQSGELGHIRINGNETIEQYLVDPENHRKYIPLVLNTVNCLLGIDRFILVGHDVRCNRSLILALMDERLQFTVTSTQQYCKAESGRGQASTAAIGAAMEVYFSMCEYDLQSEELNREEPNRINLAKDIVWYPIKA